jgi:fatty-acyl-CoA synthase/long-chain acyl-CoA synthetase
MRIAVLDGEGNFSRWAQTDEAGAVCMSGPNIMPGYLDEAHNKGAFFDASDVDGTTCRWLNSGDLGRQDTDGYFWLTGRKKELIIRGGHNIDPKTIEESLAEHPAVALAAAVGRPDAHAGELPVAYVQLRTGAQVSEAELMAFATSHISERAAIPKAIHILEALPVTAVGKIFKPMLNMREVDSVVREEATTLGLTLTELHVQQDAKLGIVARWRTAGGDTESLAAALGRHIFKHQMLA